MANVLHPQHPERVCWGCDKYCPADDLACGNGPIRTAHPCELFGDDWLEWSLSRRENKASLGALRDNAEVAFARAGG
jgi:hypothetical protein